MTHAELVARAVRWLRGSQRCVLVVDEFAWWGGEQPDAMGWKADGTSILIECKASRSDFFADSKKPWRRAHEMGLGMARYYMTPPDLIEVFPGGRGIEGLTDTIPPGWGLLEVHGRRVVKVTPAEVNRYESGPFREVRLLVNIARRLREKHWSRERIAHVEGIDNEGGKTT